MKPDWWNAWHDRALSALSGDWVRLGTLRAATGLPANAFDDLVVAGYAVERRTNLLAHDRVVGQVVEFSRIGASHE